MIIHMVGFGLNLSIYPHLYIQNISNNTEDRATVMHDWLYCYAGGSYK